MSTRITVLGAGFGGMELSTLLSESVGDEVEVTLIDKSDAFIFGYSKLDLMFGRATLDEAGRGAAGGQGALRGEPQGAVVRAARLKRGKARRASPGSGAGDRRRAQGRSAKSAAKMRSISLTCPIHRLPLRSKPRPAVMLPNEKPDATGEIVWVPRLRRLTVPVD